jgi:hypothetical protein
MGQAMRHGMLPRPYFLISVKAELQGSAHGHEDDKCGHTF